LCVLDKTFVSLSVVHVTLPRLDSGVHFGPLSTRHPYRPLSIRCCLDQPFGQLINGYIHQALMPSESLFSLLSMNAPLLHSLSGPPTNSQEKQKGVKPLSRCTERKLSNKLQRKNERNAVTSDLAHPASSRPIEVPGRVSRTVDQKLQSLPSARLIGREWYSC
jgi:hypothetical protein